MHELKIFGSEEKPCFTVPDTKAASRNPTQFVSIQVTDASSREIMWDASVLESPFMVTVDRCLTYGSSPYKANVYQDPKALVENHLYEVSVNSDIIIKGEKKNRKYKDWFYFAQHNDGSIIIRDSNDANGELDPRIRTEH
ncbi:hypothetical protein C84B14_01390 [Salinisphaera sp. C84B14]